MLGGEYCDVITYRSKQNPSPSSPKRDILPQPLLPHNRTRFLSNSHGMHTRYDYRRTLLTVRTCNSRAANSSRQQKLRFLARRPDTYVFQRPEQRLCVTESAIKYHF
jgi:hypothetical protein